MGFEIPLETVIGAAFVQSLEKGRNFVPFEVIESYIYRVGLTTNRKIFVWFSRERVDAAVKELGNEFEITEVNRVRGIKCSGTDIEKLRERSIGWLPLDLAIVFSQTKINLFAKTEE